MNPSAPIKSVIPSAHSDVLRVLALTDITLTGRQVAALTGGAVSQKAVSTILNDLVVSGIVHRDFKGSAYLHRLNRDHLAADAIVALATMRIRLLDALEATIAEWKEQPVGVWLFGSMARGDGSPASDIDLLVIRSETTSEDNRVWMSQLDAMTHDVTLWTGNECRILEYGHHEIRELVEQREPLLRSVLNEGILIEGDRSVLRRSPSNRRSG